MAKLLPELPLFGVNNRMPLSYEQALAALAQRRRVNEAIRAQALQNTDNGKMVSGHYIADPWSGLANVAKAYIARKGGEDIEAEEADVVAQRQKDFEAGVAEMPQDRSFSAPTPGDDEGNAMPTVTNRATPRDWMQWGSRMATLGPQGQLFGNMAMQHGMGAMIPRAPREPKWEKVDLPSPDGKTVQTYFVNQNDPTAPPVKFGDPFEKKNDRPNALMDRLKLSEELQSLHTTAQTRPLSQAEKDRVASLTTALNTISSVATDGGGVASPDKALLARQSGGPAAAPAAPAVDPMPQVRAITAKGGTAYVRDGEVRTADTFDKPAAPGLPAVTAGEPKDDPYAKYREDPRNAPYLPQSMGPGVHVARPGTGAQQRLNTDVLKLGKDAADAQIPTFEDAWRDFKESFVKARTKRTEAAKGEDKRSMLERGWDALRMGGGAGGPAGVYNSLPALLTSPEGQDLRRSLERIKAFERHRLFGATLTGNEKTSFEQMAGTLFGVEDEQLLNAMAAMERQFDESKRGVYGSYAPIVVDEYLKGRQRGPGPAAPPPTRPWSVNKSRITGGVDG